jgi:hypothetical protein
MPSKLAHASEQSLLKWDRTGLAMRFQSIFTSTELTVDRPGCQRERS